MHLSWRNKWTMSFESLSKIRLSENFFECNCSFYRSTTEGQSSSNLVVIKTLLNEKCTNIYPLINIRTFVKTNLSC